MLVELLFDMPPPPDTVLRRAPRSLGSVLHSITILLDSNNTPSCLCSLLRSPDLSLKNPDTDYLFWSLLVNMNCLSMGKKLYKDSSECLLLCSKLKTVWELKTGLE